MSNSYCNLVPSDKIMDSFQQITAGFTAAEAALNVHKTDLVTDSDGAHGLKIESGSWTPVVGGATSAGSITQSNGGNYYKIGRLVIAEGQISISAISSAPTGQLQITGLPFAATTQRSFASRFSGLLYNLSQVIFSGIPSVLVAPGESRILFYVNASNATDSDLPANTAIKAGSTFRIQMMYLTN